MAKGWVLLIIVVFLLLKKEVLGGEEGVLSGVQLPSLSERFPNSESLRPKNVIPRSLGPPLTATKAKYEIIPNKLNTNKKKKFVFHRPIPFKLVHKTTISSGPVDEKTFRILERKISDTLFDQDRNNEINSYENSVFDNQLHRRIIPEPSIKNEVHRAPKHIFSNSLPIPGSITGYFASPGRGTRKIGSPIELLESTLFKRTNLGGLVDKPTSHSSSPFMTITPGVVKSFPIKIMSDKLHSKIKLDHSNNFNLDKEISNSIFKRYIPNLQNSLQDNNIHRKSFRIGRKSDTNSLDQPSNVKIIVVSKVPSKNQPRTFWDNLFRLTPKLSNHHRLSTLSQISPFINKRILNINDYSQPKSTSPLLT